MGGHSGDIYELVDAAERGNAEAFYRLGLMYLDGEIKPPIEAEVEYDPKDDGDFVSLTLSALKGNIESWRKLSLCDMIVTLLIQAAMRGHINSQRKLDDIYQNEKYEMFFERDYSSIDVKWFMFEAKKGIKFYQAQMGYIYEKGFAGINKDLVNAVAWYVKAAEKGDSFAQYRLGRLYLMGVDVDINNDIAESWCNKHREQGYLNALYTIGLDYEIGIDVPKDYAKAIEFYVKSAEGGYGIACYKLGKIYRFGEFGVHKDINRALEWYHKAAELSYSLAWSVLSDIYMHGLDGAPKDIDKGIQLIRKAAEQGDSFAQSILGDMYYKGRYGVPIDFNKAVEWYQKAAMQGEPNGHACYMLGYIYEQGHGVIQNYSKAVEFYNKVPSEYLPMQEHIDSLLNPKYDIMLGVTGKSPQYGLLGETYGKKIALDLNNTHTISLFGVQGGGKSYTLGTIVEMATMNIPNINVLPSPLATVIFHYSPTLDYAPEFTSMVTANSAVDDIKSLSKKYSASPSAIRDVLLLVPPSKITDRRATYPDIEIMPLSFSASELKTSHWKFLMGAIGSQAIYLRQINSIMRRLRNNISFDSLLTAIKNSSLSEQQKLLAETRLQFAYEYVDDDQPLHKLIRPGRLIIIDLRDEYIEKDEAFGLFIVILQIISEAVYKGKNFNKLVVFDEAHKYIDNADLVAGLVEIVREMRHKGTSIMVASQDPPSIPLSIIELSTQIIMHKFNSPAWLKHIQKANAALRDLDAESMSGLGTGEAFVWSSMASDEAFSRGAVKMQCRPRITQHGGTTKTAVYKV